VVCIFAVQVEGDEVARSSVETFTDETDAVENTESPDFKKQKRSHMSCGSQAFRLEHREYPMPLTRWMITVLPSCQDIELRKVDDVNDDIAGHPPFAAMAQRHMCPSMGALRRSIIADVSILPKCSSRALSTSARRLEEQPSDTSPAASSTPNAFNAIQPPFLTVYQPP
jgi:hypothetical protein